MNIRTPSLQTLALTLLALSPSLTQAQSSNLLPDLTVSGDSFLKGTARFGVLGSSSNADGLRIDVVQSQVSRLRRVWHPASGGNSWTERVPVWGDVDTSSDEVFSHTEYEEVEVTPFVPGYFATEEYEITPAILAQHNLISAAIPAQHNLIAEAVPAQHNLITAARDAIYDDNDYNEDGVGDHILIEPAHEAVYEDIPGIPAVYEDIPEVPAVYEDIPGTPAVMGTRQGEWIPPQPATYTTVPRTVVDNIIHHEQITQQIIRENLVVHAEDVIPAHFSSEVLAGDPSPVTRFTGTHPEMAFAWANLLPDGASRRDLMTLSSGGLLFPQVGDTWGYSRASLSQDSFEHSWTGPEWSGEDAASIAYHSYGSRMDKQQVKVWNHGGDYVATSDTAGDEGVERVLSRDETTIAPASITLERTDPASPGGSSLRSTHITAEFADFGGSVNVKGVLRVMPAGDLGMGNFTNGPQP